MKGPTLIIQNKIERVRSFGANVWVRVQKEAQLIRWSKADWSHQIVAAESNHWMLSKLKLLIISTMIAASMILLSSALFNNTPLWGSLIFSYLTETETKP